MDESTTLMDLALNSKKVLRELLPYKSVMCPRCGRIQVTAGEEMFRCRNCGRSSRFRVRGRWNVKLLDFPTEELARTFSKKWAKEEYLKEIKQKGLDLPKKDKKIWVD